MPPKGSTKPASLPVIAYKDLTSGTLIGNGSFGDVYKGSWQGQEVAIKVLQLKTLSPHLEQDFVTEAQLMWQCQADNVLTLHGICVEPGHCAMVLEYMPRNSLYQWLHSSDEIPEILRWQVAIDIAKGLAGLHERGILHRDLKSFNILLSADYQAKIADFGLAKLKLESRSTSTARVSSHTVGTVRWRAPELFKRRAEDTAAADIYSYGMILWELATRKLPFSDAKDEPTVISWVKDGEKEEIPSDCPSTWQHIISACWQEPGSRPTAAQIVAELEAARPQPAPSISAKAWHFDPALKLDAAQVKKGSYELIAAGEQDTRKVLDFYHHHPVPGYDLAKVEIIYNPTLNRSFALKMEKLQGRAESPAFAPEWHTEGSVLQQQWRAAIDQKFKDITVKYQDDDYPAVKLVPAWHGTKSEVLGSLFKTGYANLAKTDKGFFGKGIYSTFEAEYAYRVYSNGALLVNWVATYSAYPVIDGDMVKLAEGANYANYDAHLVPVKPKTPSPAEVNYYPCSPSETPVYTEVVVFNDDQCLPRYLVTLQPTRPHEVGTLPTATVSLLFSAAAKSAAKLSAATAKATVLPAMVIDPKAVAALLDLIVKGKQDEAEVLLRAKPELALGKADITDHAGRTFTGITPLQVAVWNLDWDMWEMVLKYLPPEAACAQAQEFTTGAWVTVHGVHATWQRLIDELQVYIDMPWDEAKCTHQWTKVIGGEQRKAPIHVLQQYCHPTRAFEPTPSFDDALPRVDVLAGEGKFDFSKLAVDFALCRWRGPRLSAVHVTASRRGVFTPTDRDSLVKLQSVRTAQLDQLVSRLKAPPVAHLPVAVAGEWKLFSS